MCNVLLQYIKDVLNHKIEQVIVAKSKDSQKKKCEYRLTRITKYNIIIFSLNIIIYLVETFNLVLCHCVILIIVRIIKWLTYLREITEPI